MSVSILPATARETTPLDREIHQLSMAVRGARAIATHIRPDLDALLSVWLCERVRKLDGQPTEVLFLPANIKHLDSGVLAVDMGGLEPNPLKAGENRFIRGLHSFHDGMAIKMSAVSGSSSLALLRLLPTEEQEVLEAQALAISNSDTGKNIHDVLLEESRFRRDVSIRNQVKCSNMWHLLHCVSKVMSDQRLYEWWSPIFVGELLKGMERRQAREAADSITYVLEGKLALTPLGAPYQTERVAYKRGAKVVLFSRRVESGRWALGLRRDGQSGVDLSAAFSGRLDDFPSPFIHPDGFLVGWVAKGALYCPHETFMAIRRKFIHRATEVLSGYFSKS